MYKFAYHTQSYYILCPQHLQEQHLLHSRHIDFKNTEFMIFLINQNVGLRKIITI